MLRNILITAAVIMIAPTLIARGLSLVNLGATGAARGMTVLGKILMTVAKWLVIPVASLVLFAPDSFRAFLPSSATAMGVVILIGAALVLVMEMFKGLGQSLAIMFWAGLCAILAGAFQLDQWLPKDLNLSQKTPVVVQAPSKKSAGPELKKSSPPSQDGLEYSTFEQPKAAMTPTPGPSILESFQTQTKEGYKSLEESLSALSFTETLFGRDQSVEALPREAFFPENKRTDPYFGQGSKKETGTKNQSFLSMIWQFLK